jgi:hypothetical protein
MESRIFLSYARENEPIVGRVAAVLRDNGFAPWLDTREIKPGDSWVERVNAGLTDASYVLVFFSRDSAGSTWVTREWASTLARRSVPILPVLLDGGEVPAILADVQAFDLRADVAAGTRAIVQFFQRELRTVPAAAVRSIVNPLQDVNRRQLRLVATRCLDDAALSSFCFDAEIDPGRLGGASLHEKIVSLLHQAASDGLTAQFVSWLVLEKGRCVAQGVRELQEKDLWSWKTG